MDDNRVMKVVTADGKEVDMYILFTTRLDDFNKNYVFYFDPNDQERNVFVSSYDESTGKLSPVEDEAEWNALDGVFNDYMEELQDAENNCDGNCEGCNQECESCEKAEN